MTPKWEENKFHLKFKFWKRFFYLYRYLESHYLFQPKSCLYGLWVMFPKIWKLGQYLDSDPTTSGNSEISFWPRSNLSRQVNLDRDLGNVFSPFSLNSRILSFESLPRLAGRNSRKVSFRYSSVMLSSCVQPSVDVKQISFKHILSKFGCTWECQDNPLPEFHC